MDSLHVFALGMIGALAPEIVRLYSLRQEPERFKWTTFYFFVSLLFAALGGVLAIALPATTYWGAVYVGISTPVLVSTLVKKALPGDAEIKAGADVASPRRAPPAEPSLRAFVAGL